MLAHACAAHLTVRLVSYPERLANEFWSISDLFAATPDSAAWFGPDRPHPHSWLTQSVYCRDTADFQVNVVACDGEHLESLRFSGVQPGFYRLRFEHPGEASTQHFRLQFYQDESLVSEASYCRPDPLAALVSAGSASLRAAQHGRRGEVAYAAPGRQVDGHLLAKRGDLHWLAPCPGGSHANAVYLVGSECIPHGQGNPYSAPVVFVVVQKTSDFDLTVVALPDSVVEHYEFEAVAPGTYPFLIERPISGIGDGAVRLYLDGEFAGEAGAHLLFLGGFK